MTTRDHTIGTQQLFVQQYIPDEKRYSHPLVLVHGSFGNHMMWNMIAGALSENGFECYAFSLRGHKPSGKVDLGTVHMSDYVDDIVTVAKELHLEKPVVVGHSMSGLSVLLYAKDNPVHAVVSIDPSPSREVQGEGKEEDIAKIPPVYTAIAAGMPSDIQEMVKALPDIPQEMLMKMKEMLGPESGTARKDRKRGISVPKESVTPPVLVIGAELGDSVPFGISLESSRKMAEYYDADFMEIKEATHPGILMGKHAPMVARAVAEWLDDL